MRHTTYDLQQMQALPLKAKVIMTEQRLRVWLDNWARFEIFNKKTGKTRYVTWDTRDYGQPPLKEDEYIESVLPDWAYLSLSGGKDSAVLDDILLKMGIGGDVVPRVFCNTGLEFPEVRMFATKRADVVLRPDMPFNEVLKRYGYPVISKEVSQQVRLARNGGKSAIRSFEGKKMDGSESSYRKRYIKWAPLLPLEFKVSDECCAVMKKKPFKKYERETGRKAILAIMAEESALRARAWMKNGCNAFSANRAVSSPMAFWTEQDVLQYIKENNLPIASVYGDIVPVDGSTQINMFGDEIQKLKTTGCSRTGCIFCPFGCHLDREPRFERLKETHPRQWDYCIGGGEYNEEGLWQPSKEGLGFGHVFDELNAVYGEQFIRYGKEEDSWML